MERQALVVRMPNWIGDCVMALPTLNYLEHVGFDLTLIGKAWLTDLFGKQWPIITINKQAPKIIKQQIANHPANNMLLLPNSLSSAWAGKRAGKACFGYATDGRSWLLKKAFKKPKAQHESEVFLQLARLITQYLSPNNMTYKSSIPNTRLPLKHQHTLGALARKLQKDHAVLRSPFILLCPFATGTNKQGESKIWPHWKQLIEYFNQQQSIPIVCCPGPGEEQATQKLKAYDVTTIAHLSISDYMAVMSLATYIIGNDTGPMHLASLVSSNCLTLFGATDPKRTHPMSQQYLGQLGQWPSCNQVIQALARLSQTPA